MRDPKQIFIFNDIELELIKSTFSGDDDTLLYTVRKVLLQFPLTDVERGLIKVSINEPIWRILKKKLLPEISDEFPLGQLPSLLTTLTEVLRVRTEDEVSGEIASKALQIGYLKQQFSVLKDIEGDIEEDIKLSDMAVLEGKNPADAYVSLKAYLFILGYVDPMLEQIKSIAGEKKETVDEAKKRMTRNSAK